MPAIVVAAAVGVLFFLAYRHYSSYLARRVYGSDAAFVTPAHQFSDGIDFVPTNKHVVFGHHFTSVAGAAPIVGPAIAAFWGWGPALAWIGVGTIFAAGVHDMGSLAVSVRHGARNIGQASGRIIYMVDVQFSVDSDCDEGRLPWDYLGAEVWEIVRG